MNDTHRAEDLLRGTLRAKADQAVDSVTLEDVRRDAARRRRASVRRTTAIAAAAAVVAIGAPTAFLLRPAGDEPSPAPAPSTSSTPTNQPTASARPTELAVRAWLEAIPRGADPGITYLFGRTIHLASGGTAALPGPPSVAALAGYHGGWLVGDAVMGGVRWYDNTGALKESGTGADQLAASADGMRLAYQIGGRIRIGIASGMGEGEQTVPVSDALAHPVGFLPDGALVYAADGAVKTDQPEQNPVPAAMVDATAVSVDGVVAGEDARRRGMLWSTRTGQMLWQGSDWVVTGFSADGRRAAATRNSDDGSSGIAILDTTTGRVVAAHSFTAQDLVGASGAVFDTDGSLLVPVSDMGENRAVLRLTADGTLTRATDILLSDLQHDAENIVLATGP